MICPACGATTTQVVYSISAIPIHSCVLLDSQEAARLFPKRDLALAFCDNCGFAFNHIFDEKVINYSTNFEESQHFSETFSGFAKSLAQQVAEKCNVRGRHILEIGCGKGEFLRELCRVGGATGLGIDPAYRFDEGRAIDVPGVEFVSDYFTPLYEHLNADTILCRHTLEHIAPVDEFVKSLRRLIGLKEDVSIFFETPDAKRVFVEGAFWDIYYEHCSYFSPGAHARLFRRNGFDVTGLEVVYDSQYIIQYAKLASGRQTEPGTLEDDLSEMRMLATDFADRVEKQRSYWKTLVCDRAAAGQRVVLWGGGSKAVAFLTTLGLANEVAAVVDINPYKQGKFTPGTGHPVVAPQHLINERPDLVIVMNPIYVREVTSSLKAMDMAPTVVPLQPDGVNHQLASLAGV
jgi:SAM-dependent methyltransferase